MAKTREEQLLASEELNRRIMEAMPGGIVNVDANGAILSANAEALRVLGLSYDALTKRYITDFDTETVWEDGTPCPASEYPVAKALATGRAQPPTTIGVRRPDGRISWAVFTAVPLLSAHGAVEGALVTFLDITERKKAEAALRESEGTLRSILESANPIAIADRDGVLLFSNRVGPGVDPKDVIGKPAWVMLHPDDREKARRAVAEVVATGESRSYESRGLVSGRVYFVHTLPRYNGKEVVGVTFVSWDITAQRELEARLMIADRMASIGTLAAGVAHEINNPLTYLLASLERLEKSLRQGERESDTCAMIAAALEGARRIRSIVSDLSTFSHVGEGRKVLLDVRQMLESSIRMAKNEIRFRARVVRDYGDVPPLLASDSRIGQVFLNLLVNAAQAIPEGDADANEIRVATRTDERGSVVVEVSDTGAGVPADMVEKIFDPFVTTKPRGVGTGLGLYICRNIVRSLGGEIAVEGRASGGSTFRVTLPAACPSDRPSTPREA
jgi:PAS domain S-box-containing protein